MISSRRGFLFGLGASAVAAPAIVRAASLMPVRALRLPDHKFVFRTSIPSGTWRQFNQAVPYNALLDELSYMRDTNAILRLEDYAYAWTQPA